jgi:hypothetical protein
MEEYLESRLRQYLARSLVDIYTTHRICRSLRQSRSSLYTILTAKSLFDRSRALHAGHLECLETRAVCEPDRFMLERKRREMEKVMQNEYLHFIVCTIIASKLYMDLSYTNFSWMEICYYAVEEINLAEKCILEILDYDVCLEWGEIKRLYDDFGEAPGEGVVGGLDVTPKASFLLWAVKSLFRLIACIEI